jgi:outer membrane cobalamin receptor
MVIRTRGAALGAAFIVFATLAGAQAEPSYELDSVVVTASRIRESSAETPPAVSVVTREDMDARGVATVADALALVPGLGLSEKGAEGSQVSVSLRGSTTNQVLVLVDGLRINDALSGLVDLSRIPLESVERIEVMRGGGSSLHGGDALGGVVNVVTKRGRSPLAIAFENGGYLPAARVAGFGFEKESKAARAASLVDSQRISLSWGPALGGAALRMAASAARAANAYTYIDSNGEPRERENASLLGADASLGATAALWGGSLSADAYGSIGRVGVPGTEAIPTPRARETDASARIALKYGAERFLSDLLSLDAGLHAEYTGLDYEDAAAPSNDGRHDALAVGLELSQRAYAADGLTLAYGGSAAYAAARSDTVGSPRRLQGAAFAEAAFSLGKLSFRPSIRYDYYSDFSARHPLGGLAGAAGASYRLSGEDSLKLNLSRSYRVPTFNDLYWPSSGGAEGDPSLEPETAYGIDAGLERRLGSLRYSASAYLRYSRDVILWQPGADGIWRPSNFGAALYPGLEQELEARLSERYAISINYSFLRSYVASGGLSPVDDKRLPMTPMHSLKGSLAYEGRGLSWSASARYASLRYLKPANVAYLPAYFTLDALLRWKASAVISAYIAGDNLFDERYEIIDGYPMPGTRIRLGIEFKR